MVFRESQRGYSELTSMRDCRLKVVIPSACGHILSLSSLKMSTNVQCVALWNHRLVPIKVALQLGTVKKQADTHEATPDKSGFRTYSTKGLLNPCSKL